MITSDQILDPRGTADERRLFDQKNAKYFRRCYSAGGHAAGAGSEDDYIISIHNRHTLDDAFKLASPRSMPDGYVLLLELARYRWRQQQTHILVRIIQVAQYLREVRYLSVIECFETDGGVNYRSDRLIQF